MWSGTIIGIIIFALLTFSFLREKKPAPFELSDGTVMVLEQIDIGNSENRLVKGDVISKQLHAWRNEKPFNWKLGKVGFATPNQFAFHTDPDSMVIWFEVNTKQSKVAFQSFIKSNLKVVLTGNAGISTTNRVSGLLFSKRQPPILAMYIHNVAHSNPPVTIKILEQHEYGLKVLHQIYRNCQ